MTLETSMTWANSNIKEKEWKEKRCVKQLNELT